MQETIEAINAVKAGDVNHYEKLVNRYAAGLIFYCKNFVNDRDLAEDLAQETFIKAFNVLATFDANKASFSTWLYKIAKNTCLDQLRKHSTSDISFDEESDNLVSEDSDDDDFISVRQAVQRLQPEEYRKVIEAYYWRGLRYQDIARELDVPVNTVRTWLKRAKDTLREELR